MTPGLLSQGSAELGEDGFVPVPVLGALQEGQGLAQGAAELGKDGFPCAGGTAVQAGGPAGPSLGLGKEPQCCLHSPGSPCLLRFVLWDLSVLTSVCKTGISVISQWFSSGA